MKRQPVRDALNQKVPKRLEEVFYGRQILARWMDRLMVMVEHMSKKLHHEIYGRDMDVRRLRTSMYDARRTVERAMPHSPCDCGSDERDCRVCGGSGWISVESAERAGMAVKLRSKHLPLAYSQLAVPPGVVPLTDVRLVGVIRSPAKLEASEALKTDIAKAIVEIKGLEITVVALGSLATELSTYHFRKAIAVRGVIKIHDWSTAAGRKHQQFEIEAKELSCPEAATHSIPPDSSKTSLIAEST